MKKVAFISTVQRRPWAGCEELWSRTAVSLLRAGHAVEADVCYTPAPTDRLEALVPAEEEKLCWQSDAPCARDGAAGGGECARSKCFLVLREDHSDFNDGWQPLGRQ